MRALIQCLAAATLLAAAGSPLTAQATDEAQTHRWTPDRMIQLKRVGSVLPSPDAARVAFVVGVPAMEGEKSEWVSQIWLANADGSGAVQLTQAEQSSHSPQWSPDGRWLTFLSARGDETQLYRLPVSGGEAERLTSGKLGVSAYQWAPDGRSIAFTALDPRSDEQEKAAKEKRDARVVDEEHRLAGLHVLEPEGDRSARRLDVGRVHVVGFDWSPDSRSIVFEHAAKPTVFEQTDVSMIDVASGTVRSVMATAAAESSPRFSPDGRWIAVSVSDDPPSWAFTRRIHVIPAAGGDARALANTFDEQPGIVGWTADGRRILYTETQGVVTRLWSLPADGGAPTVFATGDMTVQGPQLNARRTALGFAAQDTDSPPEAFSTTVGRFAPVQVSRVQETPPGPIGPTRALRWAAPDGREVEGLLTLPSAYREGARVPLLVVVHGGPTGVFTRSYTGAPSTYPVAAFAERGYAVLRVNPRGSSGYGREFRYANYQDWGGGDYQDIMSGVDHVIGLGIADADRLGIMGWSYGGYMTSWVITQTRRFRAASVGAGVTNLMSFTGTADIPGFIPDYMGGEYWDVFDTWTARSAMFHVKGVRTPTLIQHGERDLRVPVSQGYELYNALRRQDVDVQMVVYPRQPHGITEPKLLMDAMQRNLDWFAKWIPVGQTAAEHAARR
jgi:dipeptidyl aminopeptidase/acylaminoacyl peptidase